MEVVVEIDGLKDNLKVKDDVNVAYVIECAESVGIEITDTTPLNFGLMAEIMRKLRQQGIDRKKEDMTTTTYTLEDAKRAIFKGMEQISKGEIDLSHFKHALYVLCEIEKEMQNERH